MPPGGRAVWGRPLTVALAGRHPTMRESLAFTAGEVVAMLGARRRVTAPRWCARRRAVPVTAAPAPVASLIARRPARSWSLRHRPEAVKLAPVVRGAAGAPDLDRWWR